MSTQPPVPPAPDGRPEIELRADCSRCFGLCCVALPFTASPGFAESKPAGRPCRNLAEDFGCRIHDRLREKGWSGCTSFDCFGAGQLVSQHTFGGRDWRTNKGSAAQMFAVLPIVRHLQELLYFVEEAAGLPEAGPVRAELRACAEELRERVVGSADALLATDVNAVRAAANPALQRAGELARAAAPGPRPDRRGADLFGKRLAGADLRGANLRGALLVAADLSRADLRRADLIGADLRDTNLSGADLRGALFLTEPQLSAARGDSATRVPEHLARPAHW